MKFSNKFMSMAKGMLVLAAAFALSACGALTSGSSYDVGVQANKSGNTQFMNLQQEQQISLQVCFMYSKSTSECAILAAATNATQILGGRPTAIRIASSPEEILSTVAEKGFDAAVTAFGLKQVATVLNSATAEAGKVQIVKPEVVRPEIVMPVVVNAGG